MAFLCDNDHNAVMKKLKSEAEKQMDEDSFKSRHYIYELQEMIGHTT